MNNFRQKLFSREFIFLVDGIGAALTAIMLGTVLPSLVWLVGMPTTVLYPLAAVAACYALYSFSCHFLKPQRWQIFLHGIAALNLLYCCVSLAVMYFFRDSLTIWGVIYFASEKLVIFHLVFREFAISRNP